MKRRAVATAALLLAALLAPGVPSTQAADAAAAINAALAGEQRPDARIARDLVARGAWLVDVRSEREWRSGHAQDAVFVNWPSVAEQAASRLPDKSTPLVTYCATGPSAWLAARELRALGYPFFRRSS